MAKPKVKIKRTFSYKKLAAQLPKVIADGLNEKAKFINVGIQQGIASGKDLDGKAFKKLSEKTIAKRKSKISGKTILYETGKMSETKIDRATPQRLKASITSGTDYGAEHNEGTDKLPQRKWFGINKDNKPGGKSHEKVNKFLATKLFMAWRKRGI